MAEDGGADADDRRAFFDRDFEVLAHAHRQIGAATPPGCPPPTRPSRKSRSWRNQGRDSSGSSGIGGMIIRPRSVTRARRQRRPRQVADRPLRRRRTSVSSCARSTCSRTFGRVPGSAAASSSFFSRSSRSTEWIHANAPAALRALFDCRWPIRCHSSPEIGRARRPSRGLPGRGSRRSGAGRPRPRRADAVRRRMSWKRRAA